MSKISNAIIMLDYLNTGKKFSTKALSDKLEVSERMVRYYRDELEKAGVSIESFRGPSGGYFLLSGGNFKMTLSKTDLKLLRRVADELKSIDFEYIDMYNSLIKKIDNMYDIQEEKVKFEDNIILGDTIDDTAEALRIAMNKKKPIDIMYLSVDNNWKKRTIHPYTFSKFDDKIYVVAYCELRQEIRYFLLDKIKIEKK